MPGSDQCSTPRRAAEQDLTHVSLFLCHCSILLIKAALSQRVLLTTGQACQAAQHDCHDPSGTHHTSCSAQQAESGVVFMPPNSPGVASFFPFPPPPIVSLPSLSLPTPPLNTCQAGFIWMGQSTPAKMPSTAGLCVVHERKGMWIRQEICCLAFALSRCLTPGQPYLSCPLPDRPCRWQASSLQGRSPCVSPQCGTELGAARLSCWPSTRGCFPLPLSLTLGQLIWSHLRYPQAQCVCSVNRSLIPLQGWASPLRPNILSWLKYKCNASFR